MVVQDPTLPNWLQELYPFSRHSILTASGARMNYVDEGPRSDEAVVMLHGNPTWSFYYRNVVKALSGQRRCVVPDHIGMGLSEKPQGYSYRLQTRIDDVSRLIAALGLKRIHLIVHDWGGAIGFGWAVKNSEKVGSITVLNTGAFLSERIPARIALCRSRFPGTLIIRGLNGFAGPATWMSMKRTLLGAEEKRAFLFPYDSWANRVAVNAFVKDIPMEEAHPSYQTLKDVEQGLHILREKPVSLIWGGADFCFNRSFYDRFVEEFPNSVQHYLEGVGHYVLEDAKQESIALIEEALKARI